MGYNLTIGNAIPTRPDPSDGNEGDFGWTVNMEQHPDAPCAPNDTNPGASIRWPSYSGWAGFARAVGLYDILIQKDTPGSLMRSHPGVAPIFPMHRERTRATLAAYRVLHPGIVAGFSDDPFEDDTVAIRAAATLARLEWLDWWIGWALDNCENPAMANS